MKHKFKVGDRVVACFVYYDRQSFSGAYEKLRDAPYATVIEIVNKGDYLKVRMPCGYTSIIYPERVEKVSISLFENNDIFVM